MTQTFGLLRRAIPPRVITSFSRGGAAPAGGTGAALLVPGEADALAIDFTLSTPDMFIVDSVTPANNFQGDPQSKLTVTRSGSAWEFNSSGLLVSSSANTIRYNRDIGTGTLKGALHEPTRVNIVLRNRDLTQSAWTKSNTTAALDQTGIDGSANSASSLTASSANGTCLQSITTASAARVTTAYVKRITGSGTLEMTQDGGTTWTVITPAGSSWERKGIPLQTVTNPQVGFRIATNGDAFGIDCVQCEIAAATGGYSSPTIVTTLATQRNGDNWTLATSAFPYSNTADSLKVKWYANQVSETQPLLWLSDGTNTNHIGLTVTSGNAPLADVNVTSAQATMTPAGSITDQAVNRMAMRAGANDFAAALNGGTVSTDTAGSVPGSLATQLAVGSRGAASSSRMSGGAIQKVIFVPRLMTNAELQADF